MSSQNAAPAAARPLALIADQDSSVRELLAEMFYDLGWDAQSVPLPLWPEDVLRLQPQLLLLELRQADACEALHFAAALSRAVAPANLRIVLTSTDHILLERVAEAQRCWGFQTLTKPFSYDDLVARVQGAGPVKRRQAMRERALNS
jgi:DNA-binding NtrC family response regulator